MSVASCCARELYREFIKVSERGKRPQAKARRAFREREAGASLHASERQRSIGHWCVRWGALGLIAADLPELYGGLGLPSETSGLITRRSNTSRCM